MLEPVPVAAGLGAIVTAATVAFFVHDLGWRSTPQRRHDEGRLAYRRRMLGRVEWPMVVVFSLLVWFFWTLLLTGVFVLAVWLAGVVS